MEQLVKVPKHIKDQDLTDQLTEANDIHVPTVRRLSAKLDERKKENVKHIKRKNGRGAVSSSAKQKEMKSNVGDGDNSGRIVQITGDAKSSSLASPRALTPQSVSLRANSEDGERVPKDNIVSKCSSKIDNLIAIELPCSHEHSPSSFSNLTFDIDDEAQEISESRDSASRSLADCDEVGDSSKAAYCDLPAAPLLEDTRRNKNTEDATTVISTDA
ncbi:hypothetical protein BD289DRAFT_82993 [Coniella lustricola]|uniref:Uncharacterized protein n=1 Tax=Coniella lustricola TaxID=2025994 RepID=A0A2T3AHB0_9PEZI|nr:hypothetical protein BD289DRAFT_82993 [Coniella lustricola]